MKNPLDAKTPANTLPSFLDDGAASTDAPASSSTVAVTDEEGPGGTGSANAEPEDQELAPLATADAPEAEEQDTTGSTPAASRHETSRRRSSELLTPASLGGGIGLALGGVAVSLGLLTPFLPAPFHSGLAATGLNASTLLVGGLVLCAAGFLRRQVGRLQQRLLASETERQRDAEATLAQLAALGDTHAEVDRPAVGQEMQHLLMAMQRQDEKVNNLTKAIKMYGKPLMEISGQGTELAASVGGVRTMVEGGTESTRQAIARVETQLRNTSGKQELSELQAAIAKLTARVETIGGKGDDGSTLALQQQLGRLEVSLAAMAQRLEDSEVRKSLMRLEEAAHKERDAVQELLRGDGLRQVATDLQARFDKATKGLSDGLAQMRDGNLIGLEQAVRDIQREVSGVATTVAQLNASVKSGRVAMAAPTTAAPLASAPTAAIADPAANPPPAANAPADAPKPATPAAAAAAAGEAGGYQTGTRSSGGKNVLGAIAKLKNMKK